MPFVKCISVRSTVKRSLSYILDPEKTDGLFYTASLNCLTDPECAYLNMKMVYEQFSGKSFNEPVPKSGKGRVKAIHYIQSFDPKDNITPEQAFEIGKLFVTKAFGKNAQVVLATHLDRGHLHNHIIVNSYGIDGRKFYANKETLNKIKEISDRASLTYGVQPYDKSKAKRTTIAYNEWQNEQRGTSWKQKIRDEIDNLMTWVKNVDELLAELEMLGYIVKRGKYISVKAPNQKRFVRLQTLGADYTAESLVRRIFETYASGIGIVKICNMLTREKILAPSVYAFKRDGNRSGNPDMDSPYHWSQTTVRKILSNQVYCGDTVNFKTFSKSNKLKKRIKNAPENVLVFPDTHEAIIDRKTFELVQKHFEGRKRPDKQGEIDKYAGILYCGECGSRLYLHRAKTMKPELNNFMCGGYQSRKTDCTSHYIRESVLDRIVLENLKEMTAYARENADEFYEMAAQNGRAEARKFSKSSEQERRQIETRIAQIDNTIRCLYEDRVVGRITPERYDSLAAGYESEQNELREKLAGLAKKAAELDLQEQYIQKFIEQAREYIEMPKLTAELLRVFIRRIEVFEKPEKYSRTCGNTIIIHYTFECDKAFTAAELEKSA